MSAFVYISSGISTPRISVSSHITDRNRTSRSRSDYKESVSVRGGVPRGHPDKGAKTCKGVIGTCDWREKTTTTRRNKFLKTHTQITLIQIMKYPADSRIQFTYVWSPISTCSATWSPTSRRVVISYLITNASARAFHFKPLAADIVQ